MVTHGYALHVLQHPLLPDCTCFACFEVRKHFGSLHPVAIMAPRLPEGCPKPCRECGPCKRRKAGERCEVQKKWLDEELAKDPPNPQVLEFLKAKEPKPPKEPKEVKEDKEPTEDKEEVENSITFNEDGMPKWGYNRFPRAKFTHKTMGNLDAIFDMHFKNYRKLEMRFRRQHKEMSADDKADLAGKMVLVIKKGRAALEEAQKLIAEDTITRKRKCDEVMAKCDEIKKITKDEYKENEKRIIRRQKRSKDQKFGDDDDVLEELERLRQENKALKGASSSSGQ